MRGGDNGAHLDTAPKRSAAILGCEFLGRPRPVDWGLAAGRSQNPQAETPALRGQCQDAPDALPPAFQGLDSRKNKLPLGGVMVMLFVPLAVMMA
jgi:hypothetical protein